MPILDGNLQVSIPLSQNLLPFIFGICVCVCVHLLFTSQQCSSKFQRSSFQFTHFTYTFLKRPNKRIVQKSTKMGKVVRVPSAVYFSFQSGIVIVFKYCLLNFNRIDGKQRPSSLFVSNRKHWVVQQPLAIKYHLHGIKVHVDDILVATTCDGMMTMLSNRVSDLNEKKKMKKKMKIFKNGYSIT